MSAAGTSSPSSRAEWLGARATLAGRRSARHMLLAAATFAVVLGLVLILPQLRNGVMRAGAIATRVDTLPLIAHADSARVAASGADSLYDVTAQAAAAVTALPREGALTQRAISDSLKTVAATMDALLERTANAPLPRSFRALAAMLRGDGRIPSLVDSLNALQRQRDALGPGAGSGRLFTELTARLNDVGRAIRDIGLRRRAELGAQLTVLDASGGRPVAAIDTARLRASRDSAHARSRDADSALVAARTRNVGADSIEAVERARVGRRVPLVAVLITAIVLGAIVGFAYSLLTEIRRPTLASPREAERETGSAVIAVVRDAERFPRFGGIDPFRMLYLGLTATGTRTRTVVVTGDNRDVVATTAGRLAFAAAADARATLVVDTDAEGSRVAAFYNERPEPGFSDAIAGVRLWREVTRPVGASDRLAIDVVCAGSIRRGELDRTSRETSRAEFSRVRGEYDFSIVVAPSGPPFTIACGLLDHPTVILCAELGKTALEQLGAAAAGVRSAGASLHGLALWDAKQPEMSQRNVLISNALTEQKVDEDAAG